MCFPKNNEAKIEKMWTNWSIFVLKTRWKWDYLLRLGSAEKSRVLGPSKSGSIWILKIIDFSFLEIDLRLEKVSEFSVHSTLIMKAKSWLLQKHNIKNKVSENQKNSKSLCLDRTQNHRFLVQKCEKWAEIAQLRAGECQRRSQGRPP